MALPVDAKAAQLAARIPGNAVEASFGDASGRFRVDWKLVQRDGSPYLVDGVSEQVLGPAMFRNASLQTLELRALAEAAAGRLTPAVTRFPLAGAAAAHHALHTRRTIGKVVLEP